MSKQPIIVKKIKKVGGHGHHGGAWKVAYADFVTAMMAFFLLLWLLSSTSEEQKEGIAEYFNPTLAMSKTGSGSGFLGGTQPTEEPLIQNIATKPSLLPVNSPTNQQSHNDENQAFKDAEEQLRQAIQDIPELKQLAESLIVDNTPEGLRIQIVDQDKKSMFPSGSATMFDYTHKLIEVVSKVISKMPNKIAIGGHTDAVPYRSTSNYSNWELSADRANASRLALTEAGIPVGRISRVSGYADNELLEADNPASPRNRRISILLLREHPETIKEN